MIAASTRRDLSRLAVAVVTALALGAVYGAYRHPVAWIGAISGAVAGALVCGGLVGLEQLVFTRSRTKALARRPIWQIVASRQLIYLGVTLLGVRAGHAVGDLWLSEGHTHGIQLSLADVSISFLVALGFVLVTDLDRFLGGRLLLDMLLGGQLRPHREDRVFLLADVIGSTEIAGDLGEIRFHAFLNDVFFDAAEPVARRRGTVYRYVGDMMIISWPARDPNAAGDAIRCALDIHWTLGARGSAYEAEYGHPPALRFVLHAGPVASGEMGYLRREIVYLGATLNAAIHLEELASQHAIPFAASHRVIELAGTLPAGVRAKPFLNVDEPTPANPQLYELQVDTTNSNKR